MSRLADDRARTLHYRFAHQTLRRIAEEDPARFARLSQRDDFASALTNVWEATNGAFPVDERVDSNGLAVHRYDEEGRAVVLVTMPPAEHAAEAYFVAVAIDGDAVQRYITLEHGWNVDDSPRTVLCEWTERGHVNLGDGPVPVREAFEEAVRRRLEEPASPGTDATP